MTITCISAKTEAQPSKSHYWEQIKSICTTGDNDIAVDEVSNDAKVREWIGRYSDKVIKDALAENGAWNEEELSDRNINIKRIIWTLAWDLFDSENPNECLAIDELQTQPIL